MANTQLHKVIYFTTWNEMINIETMWKLMSNSHLNTTFRLQRWPLLKFRTPFRHKWNSNPPPPLNKSDKRSHDCFDCYPNSRAHLYYFDNRLPAPRVGSSCCVSTLRSSPEHMRIPTGGDSLGKGTRTPASLLPPFQAVLWKRQSGGACPPR